MLKLKISNIDLNFIATALKFRLPVNRELNFSAIAVKLNAIFNVDFFDLSCFVKAGPVSLYCT